MGNSPPPWISMTLLIVEDNPINLNLLKKTLEIEGFLVLEASNGAEALEVLERQEVTCIISDILMPVMDGYQLCYQVRRNPKIKDIPFIFFTATYDSASEEKLAMSYGADRFLKKPTHATQLPEIIREVVNKKRGLDQTKIDRPSELEVMKEYSQVLIERLEQKNIELMKKTEKLMQVNAELQQFNQVTVGREERMIELKREVNELCKELGKPLRYDLGLFEKPKNG